MDDDDLIIIVVIACVAAVHQLITAYSILFDDLPTAREKRLAKKRQREVTPYKRNVSARYSTPISLLEPRNCLADVVKDSDRAYMKKLTHLHEWQFFALAEKLEPLIIHARQREDGSRPEVRRRPLKFDHFHRLYFCLRWLNDGFFHRSREVETGWCKSSVQEDLVHVLTAIVEGLDDHLTWPDADRRQEFARTFPGILRGCIGVGDVKEFEIEKPKDSMKERQSWSGKKKMNSYKMLSVMDHTGRFIFVRLCLGRNDREVLTSSPLYLLEGDYFSDNEWVSSDGAFDGDGRFLCSYKNPGNDPVKIRYNLAFREVRQGVENSYQRAGAWFPLLGNNQKKLPYSEKVFFLTVHAAARLHNWIVDSENLSYSALESPEGLFRNYY